MRNIKALLSRKLTLCVFFSVERCKNNIFLVAFYLSLQTEVEPKNDIFKLRVVSR